MRAMKERKGNIGRDQLGEQQRNLIVRVAKEGFQEEVTCEQLRKNTSGRGNSAKVLRWE